MAQWLCLMLELYKPWIHEMDSDIELMHVKLKARFHENKYIKYIMLRFFVFQIVDFESHAERTFRN